MTSFQPFLMPVDQTIDQLRQLTQTSVQASWQCCFDDVSPTPIEQWEGRSHPLADRNAKDHIAWAKGRQVVWLYQKFVVPTSLASQDSVPLGSDSLPYPLQGLTLRLALTWWAELAEIYVNGQLVQAGDLFDCATRIVLSAAAVPGEVIRVALRLVSPGHDDGALVKSRLLYESAYDQIDPGFVADELAVLQSYLTAFVPAELPTLVEAMTLIGWDRVNDRPAFDQSLIHLRRTLQPLGDRMKQHTLYLVGHAHLDMAWLWPVAETWSAAERTFRSVLDLQADFPELTFCHSTPALYDWIEQHRPDLFAAIQTQMQAPAARWEVIGGMWVEPELNLISSEAIARHLLYGQRYCQAKFGAINRVAWLPDSFGFCWQLPQLLRQGGIDYFVTQKLRWNDTTQFPDQVFYWQSPDGSQILSLMSAPIGEGIDPLKMATYTWDWVKQTGLPDPLWLPGVGDHGGGPTRDMLELARRWQTSPFFPTLAFTTGVQYLDHVAAQTATHSPSGVTEPVFSLSEIPSESQRPSPTPPPEPSKPPGALLQGVGAPLPTWNSELYLEFHRGCYTTHADQKRYNRACETGLYQAELWASLAAIATDSPDPHAQSALETAWKQVLFNQFHDILPGSSIPQVFVDANQAWAAATHTASTVLAQSLHHIATHIALPLLTHPQAQAIVVFNSLSWQRSHLVTVDLPDGPPRAWQVLDLAGHALKVQPSEIAKTGDRATSVSFLAEAIPSVGYRVFWLCPDPDPEHSHQIFHPQTSPGVLENEWLKITVDPATGDLSSVFDKQHQREVLRGPGNQLQAFHDRGQYWDAWNIDPDYAHHPLPPAELVRLEVGPVSLDQADRDCLPGYPSIFVERQIGQSRFQQTYCLEPGSPVLKITTVVDWQERHVLVKAAFPLTVNADHATYEMPAGAIARPTTPTTDREKAQWEVPALQWADLSDPDYGVSLLNDSKYGYDCQADQIRLTLLRGSEFPDPEADRGCHQFTYALYPHAGTWQAAHTVRRGDELNQPLHVLRLDPTQLNGPLPPIGSLLNLGSDHLVLTALKPAEDDPDTYLLRCYECHGHPTELVLTSDVGLRLGTRADLLERPIAANGVQIQPWQIASFRVDR